MHVAAEGGHLEMIKFLSPMFGSRVHEKDSYGYTVLHLAALGGHCEVARYLIEELKMDSQDRDKVWGTRGGDDVLQSTRSGCIMYVCASCMYVHLLVCAVKHVMAKQVSPPWTCLCNVVTEDSPVLRLQNLIHSSVTVLGYFGHVATISALTILSAGLKAIHSWILYSWKICLL